MKAGGGFSYRRRRKPKAIMYMVLTGWEVSFSSLPPR